MIELPLPDKWIWARVGDICLPIEAVDFSRRTTPYFRYIDISSIDREQKSITNAERVENINAPSRARQVVHKNDVLVSTVRPRLNAVAIVPETFHNEICSTGFCVLRANIDILDIDYLFAWVRTPLFIESLTRVERGIGYPAVNNSDIHNTYIPLPPLPEQRRIAAILRGADEIRRLRREANEKVQRIVEALFYDMFGDPIRSKIGWKQKRLGDFVDINSSLVLPTQERFKNLWHIGSDNIEERTGNILNLRTIAEVGAISNKFLFSGEHILYSKIRPALRKVATPDFSGLCSADIYPISYDTKQVSKLFVAQLLRSNSFTDYVTGVSGRAQIPKVNREDLLKYETSLPDLKNQTLFEERITELFATRNLHKQFANASSQLYQSFLSRAFTGELTASWREQHAEELALAARERDALLQGQVTFHFETATLESLPLPQRDERREDLIGQLSQLQQAILDVFVSDMQVYFTANQFHDDYEEELQEKGFSISQDRTKRELRTLAALGLIREVTLPITDQPGRIAYAIVYRYPQLEDETANEDLALLATRSVGV